jgi:uncharacterized protein YjbJ (UPF0337 family)
MGIDKNKVRTQDDLNEEAPIDQIEARVEAKMKKLEGSAKKKVADGLQDDQLAKEGERLRKEGDLKLKKAHDKAS